MSRNSRGSFDRKLRYRELLEDLSVLEDKDDNDQRMEKMESAVREVQSLIAEGCVEERVKHPIEAYLDSRVLLATSELVICCAEAVSGGPNTYDKHKLAEYIRENPDMLDFSFPRSVPPIAYLFGTIATTPPEQRQRVPRSRVERQKNAALKVPKNVEKLDKQEEGLEMVSRVNRFITKAYHSGGDAPLSYFHLVLDPTSFSRTVENIYYVSFLVRDGMLAIEIDGERGLPFVTPMSAEQQNAERGGGDDNHFIVSFNMNRWQKLVQAFGITKPMMVLKRN